MAGLTQDRVAPKRDGRIVIIPMGGGKKVFAGSLVQLSAGGYAQPGAPGAGQVTAGCAEEQIDNTAGADGALSIKVDRGVFRFDNDGTITLAHKGMKCFVLDDHTVTLTNGDAGLGAGAQYSECGPIVDVDADGVWVELGRPMATPTLDDMQDGQVLIGQKAAMPSPKTLSGDVTVDKNGAMTIGAGKIDNGRLAAAAVDGTKIDETKSLRIKLATSQDASGGAKADACVGLKIGDKVLSVIDLSDLTDVTADFEATITVADQIQQLMGAAPAAAKVCQVTVIAKS